MKVARFTSFLALVAGALISALAIACGGGDEPPAATATPAEATNTPSVTATATASPTVTNTPSPTPTPFDGKVARMRIPRLSIDYPIEDIGLTSAGDQLDTPHNAVGAIGWYHIYAKPGFGSNALFTAHVNWDLGRSKAPFYNLYQATAGDQVVVDMAEGPSYTYEVFSVKRYAVEPRYINAGAPEAIDMGKLIKAPDKPNGEEWITLITCSCENGRFSNGECFDRDVVFAKRIS